MELHLQSISHHGHSLFLRFFFLHAHGDFSDAPLEGSDAVDAEHACGAEEEGRPLDACDAP